MASEFHLGSEDPLDELVFTYLERAESDPASAEKALAELCESRPEHARELRKRIEALIERGLWKPSDAGELPEELGDFRILGRLGQGGMGVVLLAEQRSVGRRVALKLVRAEQLLRGNTRARFLREAHAIARLDHPGIVRVLTAGEHAGLPYLAMEYVEGCSLDALVHALAGRAPAEIRGTDVRDALAAHLGARANVVEFDPTFFGRGWTEASVRMVQALAEALQHAHERGVLHRDLKPSNVLLTPEGRVKLCDFGLASLDDAARLTGSGAQLGTLAYMAPEQVRGQAERISAATDVYSLGVTLYELLALRHPFLEPGDSAVRAALDEADALPLRARNRSVPADVEVICAKAMERDPARRYASAGDFARDLGHVLALRPIEARPPTLTRRAVRWTQRHPARAVGVALGGLLVLAGPIGWELSRAESMAEVQRAYERSEEDFRAALSAIGHVLRDTATDELEDVPRMQQARLVALDRALELFGRLAASRERDPAVLTEGAELHSARANVLGDLGRAAEAVEEYELAVGYRRRALAVAPTLERRRSLAATLVSSGKSHSGVARTADGLAALAEGVTLWRELDTAGAEPTLTKALIAQAEAHALLGQLAPARRAAEEALARAELAASREPENPEHAWCIGRASGWLAAISDNERDPEQRLEHAQRSLAAFERAAGLAPGSRYYAFEVAEAEDLLGGALFDRGEHSAGQQRMRSALERVEALLRDFPESRRYRNLRSQALEQLGLQALQLGELEEATQALARCVDERSRDAELAPGRCDVAMRAALACANLATAVQYSGTDLERVVELNARAEELLDGCLTDIAGGTEPERIVCSARYSTALALLSAGDVARAPDAIARHAETVGNHADRKRYAADLWNEYALALRRADPAPADRDERERAAVERMFALLEEAVRGGYHDAAELGSTPALDAFRADPRFAAVLALLPAE